MKEEGFSYPLAYGSFFHDVLFRMEQDGLTPDEALEAAFDPSLPQEAWTEARDDLAKYLERGASPMDKFGTVAVESELTALLYEDEEFGPIYYRGFIDWIGVDLMVQGLVHVVDYKTNRTPPKQSDLYGDVQLRGYAWLVKENAHQWFAGPVKVVSHLDAVKFRSIDVAYSDEDLDDWRSWAIAVARTILRDETHEPRLNPSCPHCPVRASCPVYQAMPQTAESLHDAWARIDDLQTKLQWRDQANGMRLMLEKAVKAIDEEFKGEAMENGLLRIGDQEWTREAAWRWVVDLAALHDVLGDQFYSVVSTSKKALTSVTKDMPADRLAAVQATTSDVPEGSRVTRRKVD